MTPEIEALIAEMREKAYWTDDLGHRARRIHTWADRLAALRTQPDEVALLRENQRCADERQAALTQELQQTEAEVARLTALVGTPNRMPLLHDERENLLAEIRRLQALVGTPAPSGWEPIATAPKDGRNILLADFEISDGEAMASGGWDRKNAQWWSWAGQTASGPVIRPTHWMPLPAPPEGRTR